MEIKELNEFMSDHGFCNTNNEEDLPKKYVCDLVESALKEGREKAISEFAERLCTVCCGESMGVIFGNRVKADMLTVDGVCEIAYEIAEAMKGE